MLKKLLVIAVSAAVLSGCTHSETDPTSDQFNPSDSDSYQAVATALQTGGSAKCTLTKTTDASVMEYYIKADKVRMSGIQNEGAGEDQYSAMLMDGTYLYTWDELKKEGVKFPIPDKETVENAQQQAPQVPDLTDPTARDKYVQDGYDVDCAVENVDDSVFLPPTDVTFTDMSAAMESATKMMEQVKINPGQGMTPEEQQQLQQKTEEMMQQFGQ